MTKKRLLVLCILVCMFAVGISVFLLSTKASSVNSEIQNELPSKSTTEEGYLKSAIELISNESQKMQRFPDGIIEYQMTDEGTWIPYARFQAGDLLDVSVSVQASLDEISELYTYNYSVTSGMNSQQILRAFGFQLEGSEEEFVTSYPYNLSNPFTVSEKEWYFINSFDTNLWFWGCLSSYGITPGFTENRFSFKSHCPPGIVSCFACGRQDESHTWVDGGDWYPFPEWEDQGVKGRTIGPVPQELGRIELADRLLGYLPICVVEEWMNPYVETYLREQLQIYKTDVEQGIWSDARTRLEQSISYLEGLAEHELANQARILFTLNLRFLRYLT